MIGRLIGRISILDEARKGNGRKLNLLVRELIELRNRDISGALHPAEIRLISRRVPLEEGGVVNVIFDGEVERVRHERGDRGNLVQRGNRRAKYVKQSKCENPIPDGFQEPDFIPRLQRGTEAPGTDIDHADLRARVL